jgi:hypothetical protein
LDEKSTLQRPILKKIEGPMMLWYPAGKTAAG